MDMTRGHTYTGDPVACSRCGDPWPEGFLPHRECPVKRYLVTLTSDDECVTHEVEWSPEIAAAVSAVAQAINAKATWSCSPRMHVNALDSAAEGEVA